MKRFEFYSEKAKEVIGNAQPIEMQLELYRSFKHSLKAATYVPNYYVGDINFLLADISSSFIPDEDLLTINFGKNYVWERLMSLKYLEIMLHVLKILRMLQFYRKKLSIY